MYLFVAALLTMLCGLETGKVLADNTVTDPGVAFSGTIIVPNGTTTVQSANGVRISFDGQEDLVVGSSIVLEAPSGLQLGIGSSTDGPAIFLTDIAGNLGSLTITSPSGTPVYTLTGTNTAAPANRYGTITSAFLSADSSKMTFVVSNNTLTDNLSGVLTIGTVTGASADRIGLLPTQTSKNNDVNSTGLSLKVTANSGTSDPKIATVGDVRLLSEPRITDAVMVDTTTVDVTFSVNVGSSTTVSSGDPTGGFFINSAGTASAKGGGEAAVAAVTRPVSGNNKKVRVVAPTAFSDTAIPMIRTVQALVANRDSSTTVPVLNTGTTTFKMFPIRRDSTAAISSVTVDKTKVGARKEAGVNALSANKFSATVKVTPANQPVKLKLVRVSDTSSNPAPLSTGGTITAAAGTTQATSRGLRALIGGVAIGREDGTEGRLNAGYVRDAYNADVFVLTSSQLASGEATVDFILGNNEDAYAFDGELDGYREEDASAEAATAISVGNVVGFKVVASVDDFQTIVSSDTINVDKKGPSAITSGVNQVVAPTRSQVKVTFDEELADSTATDSSLWGVSDGSSGSAGVAAATYRKYPISSIALSDNKKTATINVSSLFTQGGNVAVGVHTLGTPTAGVGDLYYNPVFGTTTLSPGYITTTLTTVGTATAPIGDVQSLAAGPYAQGNLDLSNDSRVVTFTLNADTNILNTQLYVQAFDATNGYSTPQGALRLGSALTANGGLDITESSAGVYTGRYVPYSGLSSSALQLWIVSSTSEPASSADWDVAAKSNNINVDNTKPSVNTPAQYDAESNTVAVQFSEGMNATVLATQTNFPIVRNLTAGGTVDVLSVVVASDKKQATYKLLQTLDEDVTYVVDFDANTTDDAGNAVTNSDVAGVDRAEFTTTSTLPTPTPTPTPGASPTATPVTTPTATPVTTPTPTTGTIQVSVISSALGQPVQGAAVSVDAASVGVTGTDGSLVISNVTAGDHTVAVTATGFESASQAVTVTAGGVATATFDLVPAGAPTVTPTPTEICEPEAVSVSPTSLKLKRKKSGDVTVTVTGANDCAVEGVSVTATINAAGKKRISISPTSESTDASGEATFTIKAKKKTGNARVTFKAGAVKKSMTVKVRK